MTEHYELHPLLQQNQQSFYGKAIVVMYDNGDRILLSYNVPVMRKYADGTYERLWGDWSSTTGKHIFAFSGGTIRKKEWDKMPLVESSETHS